MAENNMHISNPVKIESDCKQRVAFDLMNRIDNHSLLERTQKDKKYWLTLYRQCYKAVDGSPIEYILQEV